MWGQVKSEKSSLPVTVRVSKTRVLKLPIFIQFQIFSRALCLFWLVWPHCMAVILTYPNVLSMRRYKFHSHILWKMGFASGRASIYPGPRGFSWFLFFSRSSEFIYKSRLVFTASRLSRCSPQSHAEPKNQGNLRDQRSFHNFGKKSSESRFQGKWRRWKP